MGRTDLERRFVPRVDRGSDRARRGVNVAPGEPARLSRPRPLLTTNSRGQPSHLTCVSPICSAVSRGRAISLCSSRSPERDAWPPQALGSSVIVSFTCRLDGSPARVSGGVGSLVPTPLLSSVLGMPRSSILWRDLLAGHQSPREPLAERHGLVSDCSR